MVVVVVTDSPSGSGMSSEGSRGHLHTKSMSSQNLDQEGRNRQVIQS